MTRLKLAEGIARVFQEYNLQNAIEMIVADTTGVNAEETGGQTDKVICQNAL